MQELIKKNKSCRICKSMQLQKVISLGSMPPANAFLKKEELSKTENIFPLEVYFCNDCGFVQLVDVVNPELLFRNYVYVSSTSPVFVNHFMELAGKVVEKFKLQNGSLVVDIGSNDGILLKPFKEMGMKVLGIEPAEKIAETASKNGIETLPVFFSPEVAKDIAKKRGKADVITATSVFSHVDDLDGFVEGIKELLADDGVFLIEVYYLKDTLEKNLFDTIYHEHLSYFTLKTMINLMERLGMEVFDVDKTDTHGGSLRVFVQKKSGVHKKTKEMDKFLEEESKAHLDDISTYKKFAEKIERNKKLLLGVLKNLKSHGEKIVGYGAAAKANTLLNYFDIGTDIIDYIVDDSQWKQGLYTPGKHIPVVSSSELSKKSPDYILILAWNFADAITKKLPDFDKFIIPVPVPQIVSGIVEQDLTIICEAINSLANKLEGKTLLITGGSGFIGSYVVATIDKLNSKYLKIPCKVISIDNHLVGKQNNLLKKTDSEHIKFVIHDVCNPIEVEGDVDYIISAAGVASPVYYKQYPIETIEGTVFGIKNTLELARKKKSKSLLYFSSSEIYGDPDPNFIPTPEAYKGNVSSTGDRSCYDESKRIGETICMAHYKVHETPVKIVRPFNVFGPGMKGTDYRVIPTFISQGCHGKNLTVHDKGNQTRTFCYITDAVIGFFKVLLSGHNGEVYNVGNDNDEINMKALADMIASEVFNNGVKVQFIDYPTIYPKDEPRRRCPDLTKIKTNLGYKSSVDLRTGLIRFYKWFKENALEES
ncbi:NAD-dependent epimerase/dehydratase family protein [Candidatus Woesearchaeota archaeon]|nr:NAD-dependent epimerase/dehydratase family protein [Candidatus Woesearchaeota archaeon]